MPILPFAFGALLGGAVVVLFKKVKKIEKEK